MKKLPIIFSALAALVILVAGCKKDAPSVAGFEFQNSGQAFVKINYASPYAKNPSVQLKLNDVRVSNGITYTYPFPGGGLNTGGASDPLYFPVAPGNLKIAVSIPNVGTNTDSIQLSANNVTVEGGKYYTVHLSDTSVNTSAKLLQENFAMPDTGGTVYKFVNLIPNIPAIDLYFGTTLVAGNIAYEASSPEFTLSRFTPVAQWAIRPAGAAPTSAALSTYPTGATNYAVPNRRRMTVYARGYNGVTSTDIRRPMISLYYVR